MREISIKIENLYKEYHLGVIGGQTLNAELQSWWARKRGKEDPNLKLGQNYSMAGEKFYALNDINLNIYKGEALGLIGSNGAGKSTLLKILSRVTSPSKGDVWIDGRISSMLEVGTGFHGELTGRENIYMNGAILGMTKREIDKKMESIIDFSECGQFIDTPVKRYSSGMYVKLAFSVASHLDSEIMIMDEVLAVGDMNFQRKCLSKMETDTREGKTLIYVSHNMDTIRELCERCVVLNKGSVVFDGDVNEAINVYLFNEKNNLLNHYDFSNVDRVYYELGRKFHINEVSFLNKDISLFENSETVRMKITFNSSLNSCLKFVVAVKDVNMRGVGIIDNEDDYNVCSGEDTLVCNFSFNSLIAGIYYIYFEVFENTVDNMNELDETTPMIIEIVEGDIKNIKPWPRQYWGDVHLSNMELER